MESNAFSKLAYDKLEHQLIQAQAENASLIKAKA